MLENAKRLIEQYALGKRVAAAVSGGEDSMALLALLMRYRDEKKLDLLVANVEHGIRPCSAQDSEFVRGFCARHGVEFICKTANIPAMSAESGRGEECEAHFFRRDFFSELIESGKADMVATAHHARDNAETVLLHLFRGCGLKGLSGMSVFGGGIFRPFLTTEKEEICEFIKQNAIPFVTDETNAITDYARNYIRHEILPRIRERFPSAEKAVCRTAEFAREADELIAMQLNKEAVFERDGVVLLKTEFLSPPYVFEALNRLGVVSDVYCTTVDSVVRLKDCKSGARADLGNGVIACNEYDAIAFYRAAEKDAEKSWEVPFELSASLNCEFITPTKKVKTERAEKPYFPNEKGSLAFDADKIPRGCVLRSRREGDRFTPYGGGSKKLKEYLIDKKLPARLRDGLILLACGGEVLAVLGVEISDKIKLDEQSVNAVRICAETERATHEKN